MIHVAINWALFGKEREKRQRECYHVLAEMVSGLEGRLVVGAPQRQFVPTTLVEHFERLPRSSDELFPDVPRRPFVKDLIDLAACGSDPDRLVGIFNSDVMPHESLGNFLFDVASKVEVVTVHRIDLEHRGDPLSTGKRWGHTKSLDGFLIRANVWRRLRDTVPDFIFGVPYWDTGMIRWAKSKGLDKVCTHGVIHIKHQSSWNYMSPTAKYNLGLLEEL